MDLKEWLNKQSWFPTFVLRSRWKDCPENIPYDDDHIVDRGMIWRHTSEGQGYWYCRHHETRLYARNDEFKTVKPGLKEWFQAQSWYDGFVSMLKDTPLLLDYLINCNDDYMIKGVSFDHTIEGKDFWNAILIEEILPKYAEYEKD